MEAPNIDMLEDNIPYTRSYQQPFPSDLYNRNYNKGGYEYNTYQEYSPYGDTYGGSYHYENNSISSDLVDFGFQFLLILGTIVIPYIFFYIKKTLKKFGLLSPRVRNVIDRIQSIFTRTTTKVGQKLFRRKFNTHVRTDSEVTVLVNENITEALNEKLNRELDGEVVVDNTPREIKRYNQDDLAPRLDDIERSSL